MKNRNVASMAFQAPAGDDVLNHELRFSRISGVSDTNPQPWNLTWADFLAAIAGPVTHGEADFDDFLHLSKAERSEIKASLPAFIPATFKRDGGRNKNSVVAVNALVLDFDGGIERTGIEAAFDGLTYAACTTYSHHPDGERWRVIIPLAEASPPGKQAALFNHFTAKFDKTIELDHCSKNPACLFFLPAVPPGGELHYQMFSRLGALFDPTDIGDAPTAQTAKGRVTGVQTKFEKIDLATLPIKPEIRALIRDGVDKGERSEALWRCICELVKTRCDDQTIISVLTDPAHGISNKALTERGNNRASAAQWLSGQIAKARAANDTGEFPQGVEKSELAAKVREITETAADELEADERLRELAKTEGALLTVIREQYKAFRRDHKKALQQVERARAAQAEYDEMLRQFEEQDQGPEEVLAELNKGYSVIQYANRVLIMKQFYDEQLKRDGLSFLSASDFRLRFCNRFVMVPKESGFVLVPWGEFWLKHAERREYETLVFSPGETPRRCFNLWQGFAVQPKPGTCERFKQHLREVICAGDQNKFDYLWRWCAHLVQKPAEIPEVAIVMRSRQGTGKNTVVDALGRILGRHYVPLTNPGLLCGRFTAHLMDAVLVFANEAVWGGDKQGEGKLKSMITDAMETIEAKGKDAISVPNFKRIIVASNESWAVPRGIDDRRFFCLDVSGHRIGDTPYFNELHREINDGGVEALLYELQQTDLTNWHPRHSMPAGNTDGEDIKLHSMSTGLRFLHHCLVFGHNATDPQAFSTKRVWLTVVSTEDFYNDYLDWCDRQKITHRMEPRQFGKEVKTAVGLERTRPWSGGNRQYVYQFPDLGTARVVFQRNVANISFDEE